MKVKRLLVSYQKKYFKYYIRAEVISDPKNPMDISRSHRLPKGGRITSHFLILELNKKVMELEINTSYPSTNNIKDYKRIELSSDGKVLEVSSRSFKDIVKLLKAYNEMHTNNTLEQADYLVPDKTLRKLYRKQFKQSCLPRDSSRGIRLLTWDVF